MRRIAIRFFSLLTAGALVGAIASVPTHAEAKHRRVHASDCLPANSSTSYSTLVWGGAGPWTSSGPAGGRVNAPSGSFICPVNDDNLFTKHEIETLNIHGDVWDSTNEANAMACRTSWWGGYGYCGAWDQSTYGATGAFTLSPSLTVWSSSAYADFGYIFVGLPPGGGGLRGYYIAD